MFRIELKDKGNPPYTIDNPEEFLSAKSIARREHQGILVNHSDLPIDPAYLETIKATATGAVITATSKWVETVTVYLPDLTDVPALKDLSFVDTLYCVWKGTLPQPQSQPSLLKTEQNKFDKYTSHVLSESNDLSLYGASAQQVGMLNVDALHNVGFRGQGMSIAVIDAGFRNSDLFPAVLDYDNRVKEVKDFTYELGDPLRIAQYHGTNVLSCMLANQSGTLVGTAPGADYYLFKSEVNESEYPVEEDYWVVAIEYADSIGVDVVTTSLGYTTFPDDASMNHTIDQLDGQTIPASRAASMAMSKGMLVFHSAGNEGNNTNWNGKISVASDAKNIITVGSVDSDGIIAPSSSRGPSADGRIKPDLCAMGVAAAVMNANTGAVASVWGTSFATPILAGAGACLWQALPDKTSEEIIELMKSVGDRYTNPDSNYGYGVPNIALAYDIATGTPKITKNNTMLFFDTTTNYLYLKNVDDKTTNLQIFNSQGQLLTQHNNITTPINVNNLNQGIYIAQIRQGEKQAVLKFIKW